MSGAEVDPDAALTRTVARVVSSKEATRSESWLMNEGRTRVETGTNEGR